MNLPPEAYSNLNYFIERAMKHTRDWRPVIDKDGPDWQILVEIVSGSTEAITRHVNNGSFDPFDMANMFIVALESAYAIGQNRAVQDKLKWMLTPEEPLVPDHQVGMFATQLLEPFNDSEPDTTDPDAIDWDDEPFNETDPLP